MNTVLTKTYNFNFSASLNTIVSDTTNSAKSVANWFTEDAKQVNYEMHQLNSCLKYAFGILENKKKVPVCDEKGSFVLDSNGKTVK